MSIVMAADINGSDGSRTVTLDNGLISSIYVLLQRNPWGGLHSGICASSEGQQVEMTC